MSNTKIQIGELPQSIEDALAIAELTIGKTFKELNVKDTFGSTKGDNKLNKGMLGNVYQANVYNVEPNSDKEPDLKHIGLEVKVLPVLKRKDGSWKAKERVVNNIINYETEAACEKLEDSDFYKKNRVSIFICYEALDFDDVLNNKIVKVFIHGLDDSDESERIQQDYGIILDKIKNGNAHLLSGKNTVILEAATKGRGGGKDLRKQFGTDVLAKQRAFAYKNKYINSLLEKSGYQPLPNPQ